MAFLKRILNKNCIFAGLSGIIFLFVFWAGYRNIPDRFYKNRDDALITLSHARNLAEYGIVGVNPSGGRVEGYSTPAQFLLFYAIYKAVRLPFGIYTGWQTFVCAFLLGFFFIKFFKPAYAWGLAFSLTAAVLCVRDPSFLEWHGSGMENPIFHVLFLVSIYFLYKMVLERRIIPSAAIFLFIASISRVESIYYIGLLLLIFAVFFTKQEKNAKGIVLALVVFLLWGLFNLFRYLYFGDLMPNPVYAHSIFVIKRIRSILVLQPDVFKQSFRLMILIFSGHGGYLMILALPLLFFMKKSREQLFLTGLLIVFVLLTCLSPFIFGPTSLDTRRTATHMTILAVLFGSFVIFWFPRKKIRRILLSAFFLMALVMTEVQGLKPYELNWSANDFNSFRTEILNLQREHNLFRPTVGNADLGLMSWHKEFNIIDLGRIGDPVISRLKEPRLITDYLFDFAAPDILEIHNAWSCVYSFLFNDPRFRDMYEPVRGERTEWLRINCPQEEQVVSGLWIRKDIKVNSESRERRLIDKLRNHLSIQTIKEELELCSDEAGGWSGIYITRSVYRFLPELTKRGDLDELRSLFKETKSSRYDLAIVNGNRAGWYKDIIAVLRDRSRQKKRDLVQKSGRIEIKDFPYKTGFYDDDIWTRGEAAVEGLGYQVPPAIKFLVIQTYGFRPALFRKEERLRLRVYVDGRELKLDHTDSLRFCFRIPEDMKEIGRVRIASAPFVPKKEGINRDTRALGLDIQAIEFQ